VPEYPARQNYVVPINEMWPWGTSPRPNFEPHHTVVQHAQMLERAARHRAAMAKLKEHT